MAAKKAAPRRSPDAQVRAAQQSGRHQDGLKLLATLDCLRGVPPSELTRLSELCVFRTFQTGATVLGQHRHGRFLFLVLRGTLQLRLRDKDGREVLMGILARGDCCGEGPLFGDFFRRMSALAQSDCQLLQVPLAELRATLAAMPLLATALRQVYKRRMVECTLARVPLLGQLVPMERLALANLLQPAHFARGTLIMRQGEPADALYLVESGQVMVEQGGQTLSTLGEGDFFGEIALLTNGFHGADIRAITPTEVLALPGADFHRLIEGRPDLEAQLRSVIEKRIRSNAALRSDETRSRELALAVNRGLLRGNQLLVRTPSLCPPKCRLCEQACRQRHGHMRLALDGVRVDQFDVVEACRQCSVGAECVEVCPEDAIERSENNTLVITAKCNGCGECVVACPYDAVASVPLTAMRSGGVLFALLRAATSRINRTPHAPQTPAPPSHRADKCDLCHGFADLACISQCPTGALRLLPVSEVLPL